jgi:hypothetical protein
MLALTTLVQFKLFSKDYIMTAQNINMTIFDMTFVLPPLLQVDNTEIADNNWTLDKNGVTDANKWPCCDGG